jgi:hypothetical protein
VLTCFKLISGADGFLPTSLLTLRPDGIYGTTVQGGVFGTGTVFVLKSK